MKHATEEFEDACNFSGQAAQASSNTNSRSDANLLMYSRHSVGSTTPPEHSPAPQKSG